MDDVTISTKQSQGRKASHTVAVERVASFAQQFGEAHLTLACHAAFPLVLTPDLLYRIWAVFVPQSPWTAVADVLLSRLCHEVGHELYEMNAAIRSLLLKELKDNEQFGQQRLKELANFLTEYAAQQLDNEDPDAHTLAQMQQWTALAYTQPNDAAYRLAEALLEIVQQENKAELVRMASLVETFAEPLIEFTPLLVYARGIAHLVRGNLKGAAAELDKVIRHGEKVQVGPISLPVPQQILVQIGREQAAAISRQVRREPFQSTPTSAPLPPEVEAIVPTLIIGLGGTGKKVVTRLKTRFIERFGGVPPTVRLMVLDIDIKEERDMLGEREITLLPGEEMIDLGDVPASDIIREVKRNRYPELQRWLQPDVPLAEANLRRGGQQNRQLGRLAFFWNLRARNLYRTLESAVHYLRQQGLGSQPEVNRGRGEELVVYLVGSLTGGTGSGIAIDTAYLLRHIANSIGILDTTSIVGVFVLSRAFDMVRQEAIQPNTLAALQELDYFMTQPAEARRFSTIKYIDGSPVTQVDCSGPPFNLCYLIDAVPSKGEMLPSVERLLPMVIDSLFLLATSTMGTMVWSNVNNLGRKFTGTRVFSSFGVASLVFPAMQIQHICATRVAHDAISRLLAAPSDAASGELPRNLERYMSRHPLTYNDLITRLHMATDGRQISLNLLADERVSNVRLDTIPKEQWYVAVTRQVDELMSSWEAAARKRIEGNRTAILSQLIEGETDGLRHKVRDLVNSPDCGLNYAVRFLESLEARLRSLETEVARRRSESEISTEAIKKQRTHSQVNFDEEVRKSGRFLTRANPKGAREQYLRDSNTYLTRTLSLAAHTSAKKLLAELAERIDDLRGVLNRLAGNLTYVTEVYLPNKEKTYKRDIDEMDAIRRKPITRNQDIDHLFTQRRDSAVHKVVQQVLSGDVPRGGEGLFGLAGEGDEIGDKVFAVALQSTEDILQIRLESAIQERAKERDHPVDPSEWLRELHDNADVFWKYSEAEVAGTADWWDIPTQFMITGVEDTKTSIYKLTSTQEQSYCSTGDPHRITVLQMKHALDYRHMKQYDELLNSYRKAVKRNHPLHIFPEFAVGYREKNAFVQGYVYELITHRGPVFYCDAPDGQQMQLNKASQGLSDALWTFAHEQGGKLVEYIERAIEQKLYGVTVTDEDRKKLLAQVREKVSRLHLVGENADVDDQLLATELEEILEMHLKRLGSV